MGSGGSCAFLGLLVTQQEAIQIQIAVKVVLEKELAEGRTIGGREQDAGWGGGCSLVVKCLLSSPGSLGASPCTGWVRGPNQTEGYVREVPKPPSLAFYRLAKTPRSLSIIVMPGCDGGCLRFHYLGGRGRRIAANLRTAWFM